MSNKDLLDNIKKLRELTGVGFKDCKLALDECNSDIEKSIEYLRKKGIAKASKKMSRTASEGLALVKEVEGNISIIEINSETDFVAKNQDFINFCKELSEINFKVKAEIDKLNETIIHLQKSCSDIDVPIYSSQILLNELSLFHEWYLKDLEFDQKKLESIYSYLITKIEQQTKKFVHRDFHCRNLLINDGKICLIDFQDALIGPITYDLVSYLKDAYHKKNESQIIDVCIKYWELARNNFDVPADFGNFFIDFE